MRTSILIAGVSSAWIMSIIYYQIDEITGYEVKPLLCLAIIAMTLGLFLGCRENRGTTKRGA